MIEFGIISKSLTEINEIRETREEYDLRPLTEDEEKNLLVDIILEKYLKAFSVLL